ncbi:RNA polymerase sigma factor [Chitinophaga sp. RAB17]|uniref:RNA polymerase sigma factor n=1 Tax=Chitinophaga sp. RAB17 TaxID=3233049 RepID=UPI003F8DD448
MKQARTHKDRILVSLPPQEKMSEFGRLYDEYYGRIYNVILGMLEDQEIAKDMLQETFIKIWNHMDKYDADKGSAFTWMYNIARNTALDHLKSKAHRNNLATRSLEQNHNDLIPTFDREYTGIRKLTNLLKPEYRILIEMAYFRDWTQEEIARELKLPLGTIKTRFTNARKALRDILNKEH